MSDPTFTSVFFCIVHSNTVVQAPSQAFKVAAHAPHRQLQQASLTLLQRAVVQSPLKGSGALFPPSPEVWGLGWLDSSSLQPARKRLPAKTTTNDRTAKRRR